MDTATETTELSKTASADNTLSKSKLEGSRVINLYKLHKTITMISEHSASCGAPVHIIDEAKTKGLASTLLIRCTTCQAEFQYDTYEKVELIHPNGKKRQWVKCQQEVDMLQWKSCLEPLEFQQ